MNIYLIVRLGGSLTNLALFLVSLRAFRSRAPRFVKVFSGLCFLEVVADIIEWISNQNHVQDLTSNALAFAELMVYTYIFLQIIHSRIVKWILGSCISLLFLFYIWLVIRKGIFQPMAINMEMADFLVFLIPGFTYFKEIFKFQPKGDLVKDFTFWFVTASVFIFASTIVSRLGLIYLYTLQLADNGNNFFLLSGFVFMIVNILYIKAYLCLRN
jgi:hypothetical protein